MEYGKRCKRRPPGLSPTGEANMPIVVLLYKPGDIKLIFVAPKENKQSIFNKSQKRKKQPKIQKYFYLKYMSVMLIQLPYCSNSCLVISLGSGHKKYNTYNILCVK